MLKMKINMAEGDYFNVGMIVSCETCHGQKYEGEVMAFDYNSKMLALKSNPSNGKPHANDVHLVNLSFVSDIAVIKECTEPPAPLPSLNTTKLAQRLKQNVSEKQRQVNYIGVGVTPQAQQLFHTITKTINEVKWEGTNIIVMDQVTISAPYGVDNCKGKPTSQALQHVKKLVEKFHRDSDSKESSPALS